MIQEEGANPQEGKVTVEEFAAKIKEKYPEYKDVDDLTLAKAIVDKYPEYEPVVSFEPVDVVPPSPKKKEEPIPSASLDGESPSTKSGKPTIGDWWGDKWNSLIEGVSDFMYHFSRETGASQSQILEFVELSKDEYPELYSQYIKNYEENSLEGYDEDYKKKIAAVNAYTNYWEKNPEIDNKIVPYIRQRRREESVEESGVKIDAAVQKKLDDQFLSSAISGLATSIPAMVTSGATLGGSFMTTSYYAADEELKRTFAEHPDLDMTAGQQEAYKITVAGIEGILEKVGLSGALKGNPLIKKVLTGKVFTRLANMADEPTAEVFEKVVKEEVKGLESYFKKVGMGALSEFETGSLQQLSVDVINEMTNAMKGQKIFTPKTAIEIIEDALYAGAQEAVGGGVISGTVGAFSNDNIVTQEDFDKAELLVNNIDEASLKKYLDKRVSAGEISQSEADNILQTAKEFKEVYSKIPQGVGPGSRRRMYQLINQKMQLRRSIEGKDEAIRNKVEQDIKKIDQEIVNLYEEKNMTPEQRKEAGITEETLDDPNLDPYANLIGKEANEFYGKFSEEDRQAVTELNKDIRKLYDEYSKAENDAQKLEIRKKINDLRTKKVSIESKYDDSKKEAGVPSTQQAGQTPIQEQPIQEGGVEAPATGGVVQEGEEVAQESSDARQIELDNAVKEAEEKIASLRNEDGTVSPENEKAFKDAVKELSEAKNAAFGEQNKGRIPLRTKAEKGKDSKILSEEQQEKSDKIIQAIIDNGIKNGLSVQEITDQIVARHDFLLNEIAAIKRYVSGLVNNTTEQGNSKQSFSSWRQGKFDKKETTRKSAVNKAKEDRAKPEYVADKVSALPVEDINQLKEELQGEFGLLTGENPMGETMTEEENAALNQRAELWLRAKGYSPRRVLGKYGQAENSFFVPGLTKEDAIAFAKEFNQESVAHSEGLIYQDGSMNPRVKAEDNFSFSEFNESSDFVSVVNTADGPKTFQVGYDFETKIEPTTPEGKAAKAKEAKVKEEAKKAESKKEKAKSPEEIKDGRVKAEDIGKEGTPSAKNFTPAQGKRIVKMIDNFNKILKRLGVKPIDIVFVNNDTEYRENYKYLTGKDVQVRSKGSFIQMERTIMINLDRAKISTLAHEMMHAYIHSIKLSPAKIVKFTQILESELSNGTPEEKALAKVLKEFRQEYINRNIYGEDLTKEDPMIAEEFLAEYVGKVSEHFDKLAPQQQVSFAEKIRKAVIKLLSNLGIVDKSILQEIKTREEALEFINGFVNAINARVEGEIKPTTVEEQGDEGQVGTISVPRKQIEVIDAPKASEDSRGFIRKFVTDIKLSSLKGRKFVTNMYDYTNAGVTQLGNGLSINLLGGRNYVALMLERNGKELGEVSNLAAFNTKSQAEGFIRNVKEGKADLFAPHAGTLTDSWQFQHHIFEQLVNLVIDNKIMSNTRLIEVFNEAVKSKEGAKALKRFNNKNGTKIKTFNSFKSNPLKLVELLDAENNFSPDLRKALNQKIAASKEFQKAIGIKNLNQFYSLIADPMNQGISGGEIMTFVEFDPDTFEIVKTKPGDANHHPSFGWVVMAKIKRILQPEKYYKSYDLTEEYTKYNVSGPEVSTKEDPKFAVSNVTSSAGAIPKVAKVDVREQIDFADTPLYHGSKKSFDKFDMSKAGATDEGFLGRAVYLTAEYENAEEYGPIVNTFYADIKNPLVIEDPYSFGGVNPNKIREILNLPKEASVARVTQELKSRGYDAVVVNEIEGADAIEVAVLDPSIISDKPKTADTAGQPTPVSREQIDFEGSEMIYEFSWTEGVWDRNIGKFGGMKPVKRTEKSDKPIGIKFPDGTVALIRSFDEDLKEGKRLVPGPYMDENDIEDRISKIEKRIQDKDFIVELIDGDMKYHKDGKYGRSAMPMGRIELTNNHYDYYFPKVGKMLGKDYKAGLVYSPDNTMGTNAVEIYSDFRGQGFGSRLYFAALRLLREQVPGARLVSNHDFNVSRNAKNFWRSQVNNGLAKVILNTATKEEIEKIGGDVVLKQLKDIGAEYTGDIYELLDPAEAVEPTSKYEVADEVTSREQIDWQPSLFGRGQVNPAIVNRNDVVQEAAYDLLTGKITNAEYQEIVRITQSIDPITQFFLPASTKDMGDALDSNKGKLLNVELEDGTEVGLRLDIPAYKNRNIWVVSIHDSGKAGKSLSYGSVAWATNVTFGSNPKVAAFIAAGQNLDTGKKQDKTTIARMHGKWKNFEGKTKEERDASAVKKVEEIVKIESSFAGAGRKGSPWRQIGMNPFRHSYFYDRRTGQPVIAAAEVVQIGGLVYAKDVVYADKNDPIFEVTGYKDANGEPVRFQLEDQVNEERNNEETYESVEKNQKGLFDADLDGAVDNEVANSASWKERPRTMFERFLDLTRLKIQDKFRNLIKVQEDIEHSSGSPVGLDEDFRNAEALMHGRAKEELNKSEKRVGIIAKLIKAAGISLESFNDLLYAMHAQERNRYLRIISTDVGKSLMAMRKKLKMKPSEVAELLGITTEDYNKIEANKIALKTSELRDILLIYGTTPSRFFYDNASVKNGSGMTDAEARKILAMYGLDLANPDVSQLPTKIRIAVQAVRDLTADTRRRLVESGLETQDTIDAFNETYKNYVPLRGFAEGDVDSEIIEGGRRIEVRGREKRAKGRTTKADSPLTQAIISNTTTIVRAEKNNVMNKFYNLAKNNPNKDVYEIVDPAITKEYKRELRNGKIVTTAKTIADYLMDPNMVAVRVDGEYKFIRFTDKKLADAFRGANVVKSDFLTKYLGQFNRLLSSFITTYDPEFVLRNFSRDIQTAVLNLYAEQELGDGLIKDKNIVANTVKDVWPALKSIFAVEGGLSGKKKSSGNAEMDQYYREFKEDGARTEWFYSKSASEVQNDIEKLLEGKGEGSFRAAANLVERMNSSVENAVRLSAYVNARKAGVSRAKAAELAKNLTVNFNKSGEWGQVGNSLYLFFNASVQGTSRLIRSLKPQYKVDSEGNRSLHVTRAQKMAIGLTIMGSIMSLINEGLSDDDEDDKSFYSKIPDFEKERNIIIMKPNGKDYFKIPLPYGVNVFYVVGTSLADASQKLKKPGEVAGDIIQAAIGSFSPINFPNSSDLPSFVTKLLTPTIGQIPVSLAMNENYFGQTIYNENFPFDTSPKPESELGRKSGYRWTQQAVKFLNKMTGGSEFRSGVIDINPDKVDFVMETLTGGMGKFIVRSANTIDKIITGNWDQIEDRQVPFIRVFNGQPSKYSNLQEFYTRTTLVNQMQEEVKAGIIKGAEAKRVSKMFYLGKNLRKRLKEIKKAEDAAMNIKDPEVQKLKMEKLEKLRYKLVAEYNKQYERFEIDKLK